MYKSVGNMGNTYGQLELTLDTTSKVIFKTGSDYYDNRKCVPLNCLQVFMFKMKVIGAFKSIQIQTNGQ